MTSTRLSAGISFGVTAPDALRPLVEDLVGELGGTPEWVPDEHRALYHTALAHGANHLVTLVNEAMDRLRDAGVVHPERVLSPLLHAALDNALAMGDARADRSGFPRRRRYRGQASGHAEPDRARLGTQLSGSGPAHRGPGDRRRPPGAWRCRAAARRACQPSSGVLMDPVIAGTRAELAEVRAKMDGTVAVVMTMGALHAGHEALIDAARALADHVIVTIFVNPLQFGPNEDFDRYPRTFDDDVARCAEHGVEVIFAPSQDEMYPGAQPQVRLDPGPRGETLEGASRPGFFHGVLTVVAKLLHLTRPDYAFFGEKDYQQLALVRQMVADLDIPTEIVGVPIYREADGLALSSRNRYLSEPGRVGGPRAVPCAGGRSGRRRARGRRGGGAVRGRTSLHGYP